MAWNPEPDDTPHTHVHTHTPHTHTHTPHTAHTPHTHTHPTAHAFKWTKKIVHRPQHRTTLMDAGADLDMMATPLGKLPPPTMHSNKDTGPVTAPNYDDLRKSISIPRADDRSDRPLAQQMPPAPQHVQQPVAHTPRAQPNFDTQYASQDYYDPGPYDMAPTRYDPTPPPPPQYAPNTYAPMPPPLPQAMPAPSIAPASIRGHKRRRKRSFFSWDTLKNKKMWLFAVMVFTLVAFGLPKLRAMAPGILIDPTTGSTKLPALAGISCVSALVFATVSDFV